MEKKEKTAKRSAILPPGAVKGRGDVEKVISSQTETLVADVESSQGKRYTTHPWRKTNESVQWSVHMASEASFFFCYYIYGHIPVLHLPCSPTTMME